MKRLGHSTPLLHILRTALVVVLIVLGAPTAGAVDGAIEINQAAALAGGVTPGDGPGFPVTLNVAGSYVMTGNLTLPNVNTDGIEVAIAGALVRVDMNGFQIAGPNVCTTACPASGCSTGTGRGIFTSTMGSGLSVRNGVIRGVGSAGIQSLGSIAVENVALLNNAGHGVEVIGGAGRLRNVSPAFNGGDGVHVDPTFPLTARESLATCNGGDGFEGGPVTRFTDGGSFNNGGDGLSLGNGGLVTGSQFTVNGGLGLRCVGSGGYSGNYFSANDLTGTGAQASVSCIQTGTNICEASTSCP